MSEDRLVKIKLKRTDGIVQSYWVKPKRLEEEDENILDKQKTYELDEEDLKSIMGETGKTRKEVFDRMIELNSDDPDELLQSFLEEEGNTEDED